MAPRRYVPVPVAHVGRKYMVRANVDPHTLERVRRFVEKVQAHYQPSISADRIVEQLLTEASMRGSSSLTLDLAVAKTTT